MATVWIRIAYENEDSPKGLIRADQISGVTYEKRERFNPEHIFAMVNGAKFAITTRRPLGDPDQAIRSLVRTIGTATAAGRDCVISSDTERQGGDDQAGEWVIVWHVEDLQAQEGEPAPAREPAGSSTKPTRPRWYRRTAPAAS